MYVIQGVIFFLPYEKIKLMMVNSRRNVVRGFYALRVVEVKMWKWESAFNFLTFKNQYLTLSNYYSSNSPFKKSINCNNGQTTIAVSILTHKTQNTKRHYPIFVKNGLIHRCKSLNCGLNNTNPYWGRPCRKVSCKSMAYSMTVDRDKSKSFDPDINKGEIKILWFDLVNWCFRCVHDFFLVVI